MHKGIKEKKSINLEKSRYIELKEIEPVIAEKNNDYLLKVKYLYDDWMIKLKLRVKIGGMGIDIYRK